jgi:hypothetical protein
LSNIDCLEHQFRNPLHLFNENAAPMSRRIKNSPQGPAKAQNQRRKARRQKKTAAKIQSDAMMAATKIPRQLPIANSVAVWLHYHDNTLQRNNAGATYMSWRYRMNSAYDPDPLVGSGSMAYFSEWAAMYANYRVLSYRIKVQIANEESFPLNVVAYPTREDVGANSSNTPEGPELPYAVSRLLSAKGGQDRLGMSRRVDLPTFWGNPSEYITNPNFAAGDGASPSQSLYYNIGCFANNNFSSGVLISITMSYHILFTQVQNVFS